jgi:SDR family mycofactocin-dependent oxidoreductase
MGRFDGKAAFITGAARGQGRAHAIAFAAEGANLAISDRCEDIRSVPYPLATEADLAETVGKCEALGAKVVAAQVDVRDYEATSFFVDEAHEAFGAIDIGVANAGVFGVGDVSEMSPETFGDMVDVNLKGVYNTFRPILPRMIEGGSGRLIATGSIGSVTGFPGAAHYIAAKHGVYGLVKALAKEVGKNGITVNLICPNAVDTKMMQNEAMYELLSPDDPTEAGAAAVMKMMNGIPVPWIEPDVVSRAILFLASDDARYTTGSALMIDLGATA